MPINVRTKGQTGEREVAKILNDIVNEQRELWGYPELAVKSSPPTALWFWLRWK